MNELRGMKNALIPKKYSEQYRSSDNNGLTIVGTIMEQGVDIMIAILKQGTTKEMIDSFVKNPVDATTIAEAIETVGAQIIGEIGKNQVFEKKDVKKTSVNKEGVVTSSKTETIFQPNKESMTIIAKKGMLDGILKVVKDESKYDKYYDATRNIVSDIERKTNRDMIGARFPTKDIFKTESIPRLISDIQKNDIITRIISSIVGGKNNMSKSKQIKAIDM
jgi:hypothetical protein